MRLINCGLAMLCAEDDLVENLTIAAHGYESIMDLFFL